MSIFASSELAKSINKLSNAITSILLFDENSFSIISFLSSKSNKGDLCGLSATAIYNLSTSFIGFSDAAYSNGQTAKFNVVGNTTTQSSLTAGTRYYINKQGNLQTTADTPSVEAGIALSSTSLLNLS